MLGKITVIKSLAASQLVYILSPLQTNHEALKEINAIFFQFLSDEKGDKIKRNVMIKDYAEGGLKMIDIESFSKSLKYSWIKKYLDAKNNSDWKSFFDLELQSYGGNAIFLGNLSKKDVNCYIKVSDPFIKEILEIWSDTFFDGNLTSKEHLLSSPLWHNSSIKIENRPVFFKDWFLKGITKVKNLMNDSNESTRSWYQRKAKDQLQVRKNGTKESNKQQTKMLTGNQPTFWPLKMYQELKTLGF